MCFFLLSLPSFFSHRRLCTIDKVKTNKQVGFASRTNNFCDFQLKIWNNFKRLLMECILFSRTRMPRKDWNNFLYKLCCRLLVRRPKCTCAKDVSLKPRNIKYFSQQISTYIRRDIFSWFSKLRSASSVSCTQHTENWGYVCVHIRVQCSFVWVHVIGIHYTCCKKHCSITDEYIDISNVETFLNAVPLNWMLGWVKKPADWSN